MNITKVNESYYKIEFLQPLSFKLNNISLEKIINSHKEKKILDGFVIDDSKENILVYMESGEFLAVIFNESINAICKDVLYQEKNVTIEINNLFSTKEIDYVLDYFGVKKAKFFLS